MKTKGSENRGGGGYMGSGKYPFKGGQGRDNSGYMGKAQNKAANHSPGVNTSVNSGPGASMGKGGGGGKMDY